MKIFFLVAGFLCLGSNCFAQHQLQLDDGFGHFLLLAPPPNLTGSRTLTLPLPPAIPTPAGFIAAGTANGQLAIWDNAQMYWAATAPNSALNAMLPSQSGNAGKILFTDGTNTGWTAISAGGAVSVFGRTGIVVAQTSDYNFSQIAGSATAAQLPNLQSMNGLLDVAHGGTGQNTANAALNTLLPSQSGNVNKILQTDGTNTTWASVAAGGVTSVFGRVGAVTAQSNDYSFAQISGSAIASQLPNLQNMNGLLDIAHGGTGQATANSALNVLLPTQTGNANKVLQTDGTNATWIGLITPPVSSVFGRTGVVVSANGDYSFAQISGSATASQLPNLQNMNGLLDISHGGTGQANANSALNAFLPSQTGNANKVLQTDGTNTSWISLVSPPVLSVFGRTGVVTAASGDYSFSQISGSTTASQLPNLQNLNGLLDIAHGGTGQSTTNSALNALLPSQAGNTNKVLQTDGTNTSWIGLITPPVSSVFGRTGVVVSANGDYSFSQISGSATASQLPNLQNLNGLLDIAHGGTGQNSANASLNALLPSQTGNTNKILQTDGANTSWVTATSGGGAVNSVFGRTGDVLAASGDYSFAEISGTATANQIPNLENQNGLLDIAHGGTGQGTANDALNNLLPSQSGNANKVLQTDGTNTNWISLVSPPVLSVFGRTGVVVSANNDYSFSQITGSADASQLPNLENMNGLLDIAHGGTGQSIANDALNALLPSQSGNGNKILQTDGTNTSWISLISPPVSSVFGRTGAVVAANNDYSFSQISGSATAGQLPNLQNMNGLLDIAHGGTGQATANAALNALLPSQTGNANKVLQTDGTNTTWIGLTSPPVSSVFGRAGTVVAASGDYTFSQISGSATASQLPNLQSMNGLLDIAHGGTGQITANASLNVLLPTQTGNANKILQTDGTNTSWISLTSPPVLSVFGRTGTVVAASGDYSFSQISGSATAGQLPNLQNMNGTLDIAHGGTGQATANDALNALLPSQASNATKFLQTDGTNTSWVTVSGGGGGVTGSGTSTQLAFWSSSSALSSSSNLYWDNTNSRLSIGAGSSPAMTVDVSTSAKGINSVSSTTSDGAFAIYGNVSGASTSNKMVGVWGSASNATSNTKAIGILATGNNASNATDVNPALQINQGEFAMGRTSQAPGTGTAVEAAASGTGYSQEGPSGVIEIDFKGAADLNLPTNVFESFVSGITINNRYVNSSSIILVQVLAQLEGSATQSATTFAGKNISFSTAVNNRASGSFILTVDVLNATGANIVIDGGAGTTNKDKIRIGYMVINPSK